MPFTKFRTKEDQLRFSEEQSHVWIEHSPVCTKIVDLDFNLQFMSSAGIQAIGLKDVAGYYGKPYPFDFYPQSFRDEMSKNLRKARDTGNVIEQEAAVVDTDGNELWFHSTISPVSEGRNQIDYLMVVSIDTTAQNKARKELEQLNDKLEAKVYKRTLELEIANKQLHQLSETDFLTKLPNRLAFDRRLNESIAMAERSKQPLTLLMLDIDNFKKYNDKFGHDTGDIVLQKIADTIDSSLLRKTDLTARYGGEEFVILLPETGVESGFSIAEKIRMNIESLSVQYGKPSVINNLTVSIGVASLKCDALNATDLLKLADKALYLAKNAGKNNCQILNAI
ncbi:GGDEF domain-containing protein [Vibrio profundum]|uniref:sensor domain-containing diguanylate cyclase n=1 Tax=Vibrio profundum TaxID=2910247 RepID=UPI003D100872